MYISCMRRDLIVELSYLCIERFSEKVEFNWVG